MLKICKLVYKFWRWVSKIQVCFLKLSKNLYRWEIFKCPSISVPYIKKIYFLLYIFKDMFLPLDRTHYQKSISGFKISLLWKQWHMEERRYRFLGVTLSVPAIFFRDNLGWYLGFRWFYFSIFLGFATVHSLLVWSIFLSLTASEPLPLLW